MQNIREQCSMYTNVRSSKTILAHSMIMNTFPRGPQMTDELVQEMVQVHKLCCFFKSLLVAWSGIILIDDKANKIIPPRTGVVSSLSGRDLDEVDTTHPQRVIFVIQVLDAFIIILQGNTPVIPGGRFLQMSLNQAQREAIEVVPEVMARLG